MTRHRRWGWNPGRWCVFALDAIVRRASGIRALENNPDCMFRIALKPSPHAHRLADGTLVQRGDPVIELHLWNEHIPPMPQEGPDLAWARTFYTRFRHSLLTLARHMEEDPELKRALAAYGRVFVHLGHRDPTALLLRRLGFEFYRVPDPTTVWGRIGRFFVTMYAGWLIWAYNPGSLSAVSIWEKDLLEVWMSRRHLVTLLEQEMSL